MTKVSNRSFEYTKKKLCKIFSDKGFKINIKSNLDRVDFLDVTFVLSKGIYKPYMKPNNMLSYVKVDSNYRPNILKKSLKLLGWA